MILKFPVAMKLYQLNVICFIIISERSTKNHQRDRGDPGLEETNEIMDMADPEKVTRERGDEYWYY